VQCNGDGDKEKVGWEGGSNFHGGSDYERLLNKKHLSKEEDAFLFVGLLRTELQLLVISTVDCLLQS
jgi:hypothetical protein